MISVTSSSLALLLGLLLYSIYRRYARISVKHIRGPKAPFWKGNIRDFSYQTNVGDLDFRYAREYGLVWRMGSALGKDVLLIADPKALQHIFHKSGYHYAKSVEVDVTTGIFTGHSILTAYEGHSHARHRKVMNPAFSAAQLRSFLPRFRNSTAKLCRIWREQLFEDKPGGAVVAVNKWLARTTLDVLGETAFQFEFGALDNSKNEVSEAYDNMFADSMLHPSLALSLFRATWWWLPRRLLETMRYMPTRENLRFRTAWSAIEKVSSVLVDNAMAEAEAVEIEKGKKDVMSVLVRANVSENPSLQLSKHEMVSEMSALTIAGHETTANTLTWLLWELSKEPKYQGQLREEIRQKREEILQKSGPGVDFSMEDLESMPFLQALLKEVLRFHPIVYHLVRYATRDDVIPLSEPITTVTGEVIHEISISKGQVVQPSLCTYNRIKSIWGDDADIFNPLRFIEDRVEHEVKVGIFSNLMSFSAGVRGCIGWRFSLIEMQAILVGLIENFEFSLPLEKLEILRMPIGVMSPMVKGRLEEGVMMPLTVRPISEC